jgi:hypothetical protein
MRRTPRNVIVFTMTFLMILGSLGAWAASVTPSVIGGASNQGKTCAEVFPGVAGLTELKIEPVPDGTYISTDGKLSVQVVKPSVEEGSLNSFDFTANLLVLGVVVKDGDDGANFYDYSATEEGGTKADTYLTTPYDGAKGISHISFCYGYQPLTATKTAEGSYDRTVTWKLDKTVDPGTHTGYAGEVAGSSTWTVEATKTEVKGNYKVTGNIEIFNSNDVAVPVSVGDTLDDDTVAAVTCPETEDGTGVVPAATTEGPGRLTCTYTASPADDAATLNTAVITSELAGVRGATATAPVSFVEKLIGYDSGTLEDARFELSEEISESAMREFLEEFECSGDAGLYVNGEYSYDVKNEALLDSGIGLQAEATVHVTCTLPPLKVTKTAAGTYDRTVEWTLDKSVDVDSLTGFAGQEFDPVTWTVLAKKSESLDNYKVTGTIAIHNPAAIDQTITMLTDVLTPSGVVAAVNCPSMTVAAGATMECTYEASPPDATDWRNHAQVKAEGNSTQTARADITWRENLIGYDSGTLTDDRFGFGEVISGDFTKEFGEVFICPAADSGSYQDGVYRSTETNTAHLNDNINLTDSAEVDLTCYLPADAKVVKTTTEGSEDIGQFPFSFELYDPSGTLVETKTLLTGGGTVYFDAEIKTAGTWKVVEVLPDGWVSQDESLRCTFEVDFPASAGQTYTCEFDNVEMSRVDLLKLTNGLETTEQTWSFSLYAGPDGFGNAALASDATPPALLDFGNLNLDPAGTYTLCELEVPAGYSTLWQLDTDGDGIGDITVMPYNPNADDDPPEDLGNRCVDIGAGTNIPLVSGETLHFVVDNQMPGGAPRTPGYWKNWNRCTGGGQQYTADANGGWKEGFWLLEDVLDPEVGGGIVWDDILNDTFTYPITKCEVAVDILDKRLVGDEDVVGDGKKVASQPLHNLATHLLAAQLNFGAGACTTQEVLDAALQAETLLDKYDFNGNGHRKLDRKSPDIGLAGDLASYLDDYNNGEFCGDGDGS